MLCAGGDLVGCAVVMCAACGELRVEGVSVAIHRYDDLYCVSAERGDESI